MERSTVMPPPQLATPWPSRFNLTQPIELVRTAGSPSLNHGSLHWWSFSWTLLCWVKAWVGLQESVELAGEVADQAASDFGVGLALGPAPLGRGAGGRVIAQPGHHDQVQGLVEVAVPERCSRTRTVWPLEAGMGAAPASMAKAASLGQRPGWDQAQRTMAATIGPTPHGVRSSGCQARTRW